MAETRPNSLAAEGSARPDADPGLPDAVRRRYLADRRGGPGVGYYVDAIARTAAFRDTGRRLVAGRNDPHVVRDLVDIARHRGWRTVRVSGEPGFRREIWLAGQAKGVEVRGYRPTDRDREAAGKLRRRQPPLPPGAQAQLAVAEAVIRSRIAEPDIQARLMAAARSRIADWLDRGARFEPPPERRPPDRHRHR